MEYIGIKVTPSGGEDRSHGNVCRIERSRAEIKSEKMPDAKKQTDMIQVDDRVYEHREADNKIRAIEAVERRQKLTSLDIGQGVMSSLKVFDLRPESDGNRVLRKRTMPRQLFLGRLQLQIHR